MGGSVPLHVRVGGSSSAYMTRVWGPSSPYLTRVGGHSSAYLTRVGGLREVKIKYIFVYFSLNLPLLEVLLTVGHYLYFNVSPGKFLSKSNVPL